MAYIIIWVQVDGVQGYDEDQIALVIPDLSHFMAWIPMILGAPMISHIMNIIKERDRCPDDTLGKHPGSLSFGGSMSYSHSGRR